MAAAGSQLWMPPNQQQQEPEQEHDSIPSAEETEEVVMDGSTVAASADEGASSGTQSTNSASGPTTTSGESRERLRRHETVVQNLRNLEEERENRRRRTSTCILIATFFLFRLWVEALASSDSSLLLVALLLTSWVLRWVQTNRETEDEIDRAIQEYIQRADEEEGDGILSRSAMARASAIENGDLRLMNFQAQLALAILESQRQMMENGGYGVGDNDGGGVAVEGLDDEAKAQWQRFSYHANNTNGGSEESEGGGEHGTSGKRKKRFGLPLKRGGYGSVPAGEAEGPDGCNAAKKDSTSDPACSICLCDYEDRDEMAKVKCGHTYHFHCIHAWAESHHRCPLCNYDMRGAETNV